MIINGLCKRSRIPSWADQDVLKQAAKNILSARNSGRDARLSAAIQVLDMVTLDLRERLVGHDMTAMSRNKGAAGERGCSASCRLRAGVAVRRKLGAARDGGCDGMDVPGWAVEVKRTEVLTLPPFWAQAKRQAERNWPAAGFVLAKEPGEVGGLHGPARPRPRDFSAWWRSAVDAAASVVRDGAGWAENKPRRIGGMKYELHHSAPIPAPVRDRIRRAGERHRSERAARGRSYCTTA